jgi:hypothetical protein
MERNTLPALPRKKAWRCAPNHLANERISLFEIHVDACCGEPNSDGMKPFRDSIWRRSVNIDGRQPHGDVHLNIEDIEENSPIRRSVIIFPCKKRFRYAFLNIIARIKQALPWGT